MKKKLCTIQANLKVFLLLVILIPFGIALPMSASAQDKDETGATIYQAVEEMPTFPGGKEALAKIIGDRLRYPASAEEKNIQGKVTIKFCVTPQGGITMLSVFKSVDPDLDKEAMRVVKSLPKFNPGKKAGVPVPVWYLIPISFKLQQN